MKKFVVPFLLPFLIQCGSKNSNAGDGPAAENKLGTSPGSVPPASSAAPLPPVAGIPAPGAGAGIVTPVSELNPKELAPVSLSFQPKVGSEDLLCTDKSPELGKRAQVFADLRLFVSNLSLIDDKGQEIRVQLDTVENNSNLQFVDEKQNSIALLNFLESDCASSDATEVLNNSIKGLLNQGQYKELRFQLGLPYAPYAAALTAMPAALAPSDMGWMWEHLPADIQLELYSGQKKKVLNFLTTEKKQVLSFPIQATQTAAGLKLQIQMDLGRLFPSPSDAPKFVNSLETACNNKKGAVSENTPNCAYAYKALGLEVVNPKEAYKQNVFSVVP